MRTALTTLVFWLPFVRGLFDGVSYEWGGFGFSGRGAADDYWAAPVFMGVAAALVLFWMVRDARKATPQLLLLRVGQARRSGLSPTLTSG